MVNPHDCCGVPTQCCADTVPDRLNATITTGCGSYSGQIVFDHSGSSSQLQVWKGDIDIQCKDIFGVCNVACNVLVKIQCQMDITWAVELNMNSRPAGAVCKPFYLSYDYGFISGAICRSCNDTFLVEVTE